MYARRGRGDSGDTIPYAVEREIEAIDALIKEAGGSAHLFVQVRDEAELLADGVKGGLRRGRSVVAGREW